MGYQESYMRMTNGNFELLVDTIKSNGKEAFDMNPPVEIITLLKTIDTECGRFKKGEKFIYLVGERHGQRNLYNFFEYSKDVPTEVMDNADIYFTEYFPSDDIFENNDKTKIALHEPFVWD